MLAECILHRPAVVRAAACACAALLAGCAAIPETPYVVIDDGRPVTVTGSRGTMSPERSAAVLRRQAERSASSDILERHVAVEQALTGSPLVAGNRVTLLQDGPATYQAMFAAIRSARDHVNLQTYIFEDDEIGERFADLLLRKQAQGVQVNIIYDSVGALKTDKAFFDRMRAAGVRVLEFNPVNPIRARAGWAINHRGHRKLLVVDGRIALLGGINISSVYSGSSGARVDSGGAGERAPWRDTHAQIEGPVVQAFQELFVATWQKQKGDPLPARDYFPKPTSRGSELVRAIGSAADEPYSTIYATLLSAINSAERSVYITMAYFVPDEQLLQLLAEAAGRGVDVKLILPGFSDFWAVFHAGRTRYAALLEAGVRIFERRAALLHAKTVVVDTVWSTIGSSNMDARSFLHNDELNAVILGRSFATEMEAMFRRDLAASSEITREAWHRRSLGTRIKEWTARLWEYWL